MICRVYLQKYDLFSAPRSDKKRLESENGLSLLEYALRDTYNAELSEMNIQRGEHGKPYFPNFPEICFNISHSGDYAAAAVSDSEIGVDVQVFRNVKENLIKKVCRGAELDYIDNAADRSRAFIHLWALKESYIKAIGMGLAFSLNEIEFDLRRFDGNMTSGRLSNREGTFYLRDYGRFALAVCSLTGELSNIGECVYEKTEL